MIWAEFRLFWMIFAGAVAALFLYLTLSELDPWHFGFDGNRLTVATPWWMVDLGHEAFDARNRSVFTGIYLYRRIPGSRRGQLMYDTVYSHELKRIAWEAQ